MFVNVNVGGNEVCIFTHPYLIRFCALTIYFHVIILHISASMTYPKLCSSSGRQMSRTLAAIVGGAAGAVALVGILLGISCFCIFRKRSISTTSDTASSDPSLQGHTSISFLPSFFNPPNSSTNLDPLQLVKMLNWPREMPGPST